MKNHAYIILMVCVMTSCKTNELYINVLQPAPVTLPPDIRKVGIINRSIPTDETKLADAMDKALTLEGADLDSDGAWESIAGLTEELKNNDRFDEVKMLKDISFRASRIGVLPAPLSGSIIDSICSATGTDVVFALERFDTDTHISASSSGKVDTQFGNIPFLGLQVSMETIIKTGWRIYYPQSRDILDEFSFAESLVYTAKGINIVAAGAALKDRKNAVREVSRNAGHTYALRLLPYNLEVTRDYFVKGTNLFKIAKRKAQTGKWDEAGELWKKETVNQKPAVAGRAWYNMAILSEIKGDLDTALQLAQRSWEDYKIRQGLKYSRILENRQYEKELLEIQEIR
jgi:hypothetical protein